jgi:hypothetical protein
LNRLSITQCQLNHISSFFLNPFLQNHSPRYTPARDTPHVLQNY